MSDNTWPATAKQRRYGRILENQLGVPLSPWQDMTVSEASERIDYLVTEKRFRQLVNTL